MKLPIDDSDSKGPDLTPVIDVVFLLLIFFLVASRFDQQEREMNLKITEVVKAQPMSAGNEVIVNITEKGKYIIVEKEHTEKEVEDYLAEWIKKNPHHKVLVRADAKSEVRYTQRLVALCKKLEIESRLAALQEPTATP